MHILPYENDLGSCQTHIEPREARGGFPRCGRCVLVRSDGSYVGRFGSLRTAIVSIAANGFGAVLVVVYSYPDEQAIRVISARRAEPLERKQYEEGR